MRKLEAGKWVLRWCLAAALGLVSATKFTGASSAAAVWIESPIMFIIGSLEFVAAVLLGVGRVAGPCLLVICICLGGFVSRVVAPGQPCGCLGPSAGLGGRGHLLMIGGFGAAASLLLFLAGRADDSRERRGGRRQTTGTDEVGRDSAG
jgi:hypothetical protein